MCSNLCSHTFFHFASTNEDPARLQLSIFLVGGYVFESLVVMRLSNFFLKVWVRVHVATFFFVFELKLDIYYIEANTKPNKTQHNGRALDYVR